MMCPFISLLLKEMSQCYWPQTTGAEVNVGPLTVQNVSEKTLDDYTLRQLKITYSTVCYKYIFVH